MYEEVNKMYRINALLTGYKSQRQKDRERYIVVDWS